MQRPIITCPKCSGKGEVELNKELYSTLLLVKKIGRATARQIDREIGLMAEQSTAMNNRLEKLRKLDLLQRERKGKSWEYFVK